MRWSTDKLPPKPVDTVFAMNDMLEHLKNNMIDQLETWICSSDSVDVFQHPENYELMDWMTDMLGNTVVKFRKKDAIQTQD